MSNKRKQVFFSAILGNVLEYYDFTVYTVFSIIIGKTFFGTESEFVQILSSLAVFAVGFLTRPIGGIVFGYIGDRYGRRIALIYSMLGMTIPTFAIGLIPSYNEIGFYAPLLLVIMRLCQGLCISGEGTGAAIFVLEHYGNLRPALTTSIIQGSNITGTLIASFVGIVIEKYFSHIHEAWRAAFILGGIMGIVGFYLRLRVAETPIFQSLVKTHHTLKSPLMHVIQTSWRFMILTFCVGGMASSVVYLIKTYVNVFFSNIMHYDQITSLIYLSYASFILMIAMPLFGYLADIFGQTKVIVVSAISLQFVAIPILILMSYNFIWCHILSLTLLSIMAASVSGIAYIFVISLFTPEERFTGVAFSYNLGTAIFGGTSAIVSRWLVEQTGLFYSPAFYIMGTSMLFLCTFYFLRKLVAQQTDQKSNDH